MSGGVRRPPRRWPDVLLGALVLAVLGGVGGLLINERRTPTPALPGEEAAVPIPESPGTVSVPAGTPAPDPQAAASAPQGTTDGQQAGQIPPVPDAPPVPEIPPPPPPPAPVIPAAPAQTTGVTGGTVAGSGGTSSGGGAATPSTSVQNNSAPAQAPAPSPAQAPVQASPAAPTPVTAPPRAGGAVPTTAARNPYRSEYRVMLGSFGSPGAIRQATSGVAGLGYTVYPISVGGGYVAQVGPFANEAAGRQALADIQRVYPGAALYAPRGQSAPAPAASSAPATPAASPAPATPTPSASTPEPTTPSQVPTPAAAVPEEVQQLTEATGRERRAYLQVGAFSNPAGAQELAQQLRGLGFTPVVSTTARGLRTVLVGPFAGAELERARTQLGAAGLNSFAVSAR